MENNSLNSKKLKNNIFFTFFAQFCYLIFSVIMSLILPKLVGVTEFSYWQLFIFYSSYVGFAHLGITDGMYLRAGGKNLKSINKEELSTLFWYMMFLQLIISIFIILASFYFNINFDRRYVIVMTAVYMIFANATWFMEFVFQATDNIKSYSYLTIFSRLFFIFFLALDLILKNESFKFFITFFVLSQEIACLYGIFKLKDQLFYLSKKSILSIKNVIKTSKAGIKITVSNTVSILILGIGQFFIDSKWGITSFGKLSFSFSLTTFILQFISQFSLVFFPALRKVDNKNRKIFFKLFHRVLNSILPIVLIGYVPIKIIMDLWMPQYSISFYWLALLLPICIFDGKMNMLFSILFKVERKENLLLKYNLISLMVSFVLILISVYVLDNKTYVPISITIAIFIRSYLSERNQSKKFHDYKSFRRTYLQIVYTLIYYVLLLTNDYLFIFLGTLVAYFALCFDFGILKLFNIKRKEKIA